MYIYKSNFGPKLNIFLCLPTYLINRIIGTINERETSFLL